MVLTSSSCTIVSPAPRVLDVLRDEACAVLLHDTCLRAAHGPG